MVKFLDMNLENINNLIVILLIGSLTLLALIKISNPLNINKKGNLIFGIFSLTWLTFWFEEWMDFAGIKDENPLITGIVNCMQIFAPILLYISILLYSKPYLRFKTTHLIHLIIPILYLALQIIWGNTHRPSTFISMAIFILMLSTALLYSSLSYLQIRQHKKQLLQFASNTHRVSLKWLEHITILLLLNTAIAVGYNLMVDTQRSGLIINALNLISVGFITYQALRQKEIYPVTNTQQKELDFLEEVPASLDLKRKILNNEELEIAKSKLTKLMEQEKSYLDSDINLAGLAEIQNTTVHQLSYTLNTGFGMNFFQYINQYRIERAKELLSTGSASLTILAVAFDSGFNSKTTFNTTFKKITGETPSEFRRKHQINT